MFGTHKYTPGLLQLVVIDQMAPGGYYIMRYAPILRISSPQDGLPTRCF